MIAESPELVVLAQRGDAAALGELLARHRAGMMAVALSVLPRAADAEDAVQDASLTALTRIGDLRDPAAAGPWLKMIVRNVCRMRLRAAPPVLPSLADPRDTPEELLERQALRDWVAHAMGRLSAPLRAVTMLRYFSSAHSYDEIAAICGVPSGTVRRRLHEARKQLSDALGAARHAAYDGASGVPAAHRAEAEEAARSGREGTFGAYLRGAWHPDVTAAWSDGRRATGIPPLVTVMERNVGAGMVPHVADVSAARDLLLWEIDVRVTGAAERTCAPQAYWLMSLDRGRVSGLRVFQR
ncbi:RNA polymerase sigma factor [Catenuloplanes japonicus]|uniref:RNA polymerase sigma factor n=1 Tax=Catenuloplanes japonicus TaxID=33876 RepID=UPI0005276528|nr:sigma-70 family RNA polymerase sigma factor [Catenuloplanes japonicus]